MRVGKRPEEIGDWSAAIDYTPQGMALTHSRTTHKRRRVKADRDSIVVIGPGPLGVCTTATAHWSIDPFTRQSSRELHRSVGQCGQVLLLTNSSNGQFEWRTTLFQSHDHGTNNPWNKLFRIIIAVLLLLLVLLLWNIFPLKWFPTFIHSLKSNNQKLIEEEKSIRWAGDWTVQILAPLFNYSPLQLYTHNQ